MNPEEVYEIKKTWEGPAQSPSDTGVAILLRFFEKYPDNMKHFSAFKDMEMSALNDYARFKTHAGRIVKVFDDSIQALGYDWAGSKLEEMWENIAIKHFKMQIPRKSFNELKEVILEVLTSACNLNDKQIEIWCKLLDVVYTIIFNKMDKLEKEKH